MIERTTPKPTPKIIARMVTISVPLMNPSTTGGCTIAAHVKGQSNAGLLISCSISIAVISRTRITATTLPGWRTGTAWIGPGRSSGLSDTDITTG